MRMQLAFAVQRAARPAPHGSYIVGGIRRKGEQRSRMWSPKRLGGAGMHCVIVIFLSRSSIFKFPVNLNFRPVSAVVLSVTHSQSFKFYEQKSRVWSPKHLGGALCNSDLSVQELNLQVPDEPRLQTIFYRECSSIVCNTLSEL